MKLWLAAVVGLSGCHAMPPAAQTPQQVCAANADSDPAVKELIIKAVSNGYIQTQSQGQIADARHAAISACLKRQGLGPTGGGVERQTGETSSTVFGH
jgi:1-deoxy-D-xylulose 5-phosphate reductoisomerase